MDFTKAVFAASGATVALAATLGTAAFAQSSSGADTGAPALNPVACAAAIDAHEAVLWPAKDAMYAAEKAASMQRTAAMKAALSLDDTARKAAMKAAQEEFRSAMDGAMEEFRTATEGARDALKDACPAASRMMMHGGMKGSGGRKGMGSMMHKMRGMGDRGGMMERQQ